ncbi:MAG: hypothetical protein KDA46_08375, partial [Parvularculaceae bacterium]|nr:hypothetical protein [Parvularculaceae bacterium]
ATLTSAQFGWIKPAGSPATGEGSLQFVDDGVELQSVKIDGDAISVDGKVKLDKQGRLLSAEFPAFRLEGAADLALSAIRQPGGRLSMTVIGDYLNGASFAEGILDMGGASAAPAQQDVDAAVTARIERVDMRGGVPFTDASFDYRRKGDMIEAFAFSAMGPNHKPVSLNLKPTGEESGLEQAVVARSDDIGSLLAGIFGIGSVKDGEGVLEFVFTPGDEGARGPAGTFQARNLRIVRAPLLAKVFAAGSLTGLADLMNGQGIEIANAYSKFSVVDGVVDLEIARATGPSVGMTAQGRFDLSGERDVDLDGAVAPAYGVNSLLGKTPIIGDLFVNREGEGLLALSYQVSGPASEPRVSVNPLSALTPGVFRRMFEEVRPDLAPADQGSNAPAATDAAPPPDSSFSDNSSSDLAAPVFTIDQPPPVEQ